MVIGSLNERLLGIIGGEEAVRRVVPQDVVAREIPIASADERGSGREREREEGADKREKRRGDVILSVSVPICKWLIGPVGKGRGRGGEEGEGEEEESSSDVATSLLPAGYTFHDSLSAADLRLTISRTAIPKTVDALAQLGCVGVRYSCQEHTPSPPPSTIPNQQTSLIAWAFLSHDGSLSTLHVEPPHRRQGLAKAMSRRLLQRLGSDASGVGFRAVVEADGMERAGRGVVGDDDDDGDGDEVVGAGYGYGAGEGWAHSDVAEGNVESAGVARGIGGREGWRVRWVGVDLGAVGGEVGWGGC